jgi:uncharacterized protein YqhQ
MKYIFRHILLILSKSAVLVGGQAVIEGVMMRVPGAYATAVRDPKGEIQIDKHDFISLNEKKKYLKLPVLRGMIGLFEAMKIGFSTLQWSADIAMPEEKEKSNSFVDGLLTFVSVGFAIGLFFIAPIGLATWLFEKDQEPFFFNIISGAVRITFFLVYLLLISLMKDVRRLFQYHGAEHKTIFAFEAGRTLNPDSTRDFTTFHPRCGTSFLFIIMIVAILTFAVLDSIIIYFIGEITVWMRLVLHIPFIPLVAGLGYEVLKLTAKHRDNVIFRGLSQPGLWLQRITTKEPDDEQLEVAITALKSAFGDKLQDYEGKKHVAEAIG